TKIRGINSRSLSCAGWRRLVQSLLMDKCSRCEYCVNCLASSISLPLITAEIDISFGRCSYCATRAMLLAIWRAQELCGTLHSALDDAGDVAASVSAGSRLDMEV